VTIAVGSGAVGIVGWGDSVTVGVTVAGCCGIAEEIAVDFSNDVEVQEQIKNKKTENIVMNILFIESRCMDLIISLLDF